MKKKIGFGLAVLAFLAAGIASSFAGTVRTKDRPKEEGGYYDESYHLKGKGNREGYVKKKHNWRSPFKGFGETGQKGKGVGPKEMPHSR
jgi:hypothetical protein